MGLGKTSQAILAAKGKTLIIAPAMLVGVWRNEIDAWRPGFEATITSYSRICARNGSTTNPWPRIEYQRPWDTIICDEAHYLKNRQAKWTRATRTVIGNTPNVYLLTGTPIPNWAYELFVLLQILHPKDNRFTSYWRWINKWFSLWKSPWGGQKVIGLIHGETWDSFYKGNDLDTLMLRRLRDEVLPELPPLTEQVVEVDMTPAQRKAYNELKRDYATWIEETQTEISVWNDGGRTTKLDKLTTGLETEDPQAHGSGKLDMVAELINDMSDSPLVFFCHYRNTATATLRLAEKAGKRARLIFGGVPMKERTKVISEFQNGGIDVLVGTIDTIGEGITLTRSSICVFIEHSWRPSQNEQAMRRLHRIGQTRPVSVIRLITKNSLDQRMQAVLKQKTDEQVKALTVRDVLSLC
jgi:SNF2 family DNA or RNA helicase